MRFKRLALPVLVSLACSQLAAAPTTLRDTVEQAILHNPEVKFRLHNFQSSSEEQRVAQSGYYPSLDVDAFSGRDNKHNETTVAGKTNTVGPLSYSHPGANIQLRQMLFDGFATRNEVRKYGQAKLARYYDLLAVTDDTALEAARAYIDVLRYRELSRLARDNYAIHRDLHSQLAERAAAGVGRKVDLEQAAGRLALAESNWLTEESNLHDVSARFTRVVGEAPPPNLAAMPKLPKLQTGSSEFLSTAIRDNPGFKATVATIRANRADADARRSAYSPSLKLRASQNYDRNQDGVSGSYRSGSVRLVMNMNLFSGGADSARVRQYAEQLNAAYDLRDKACRDLRQTIQIAWNDMARLQKQAELLSQHELSTSKARDAYRQQFDIGQRSLLDLLDTENELFQARRNLTGAEHDLQLAEVRLLAYASRILPSLQLRPAGDAPEEASEPLDGEDKLTCDTNLSRTVVLDKAGVPPSTHAPLAAATPLPASTTQSAALEAAKSAAVPPAAPAASAASPTAAAEPQWQSLPGDTLKKIAEHFFGSNQAARIKFIKAIKQLNPTLAKLGALNKLPAGSKIKLPALPAGKVVPADRLQQAVAGASTAVANTPAASNAAVKAVEGALLVKAGMSLKTLADHYYPNNLNARVAFVKQAKELNPGIQGAFQALPEGMQLKLPAMVSKLPQPGAAALAASTLANGEVPIKDGHWQTRAGDTLKKMADHFHPNDQAARVRFVAKVKQLNPTLNKGAYDRLPEGVAVLLPKS